jgi:hypothetical protein
MNAASLWGGGIVSLNNYSVAFILTAWTNQIFSHRKDDMLEDQFERELWVVSYTLIGTSDATINKVGVALLALDGAIICDASILLSNRLVYHLFCNLVGLGP